MAEILTGVTFMRVCRSGDTMVSSECYVDMTIVDCSIFQLGYYTLLSCLLYYPDRVLLVLKTLGFSKKLKLHIVMLPTAIHVHA